MTFLLYLEAVNDIGRKARFSVYIIFRGRKKAFVVLETIRPWISVE